MRGHPLILTPRTSFQNTQKSFICVHGLARLHRCLISRGAPTSAPAGTERSTVADLVDQGLLVRNQVFGENFRLEHFLEARQGRAADPLTTSRELSRTCGYTCERTCCRHIPVRTGCRRTPRGRRRCLRPDPLAAHQCRRPIRGARSRKPVGRSCATAPRHSREPARRSGHPAAMPPSMPRERHDGPAPIADSPQRARGLPDGRLRSEFVLYLSALHRQGPAVSRRRPALLPDQGRRSCTPHRCQPNPRTGSHPCPRSDDAATCRCVRADRASCSSGRSC